MIQPKLTPVQAEVLARLTDEWQPEWDLILGGSRRVVLKALVKKGYAESRWPVYRSSRRFDYRLARKEDTDDR